MRKLGETKRGRKGHLFVHKGDMVLVLAGKDEGKRGRVLKALPQDDKVIVEGLNIVKRHQKARSNRPTTQIQSGIIEKPAPMYASKVMVVCPTCDKPTRVAHRALESGVKVRWCRQCNSPIDQR